MDESVIRQKANPAVSPDLAERSETELRAEPGAELALVCPTFNECDNVAEVYERVRRALADIDWELAFVDDNSSDGTAEAVAEIALRDRRVRLLRRIGRRGLSSACIEGFLATTAPYVAVMDADLQHDERLLPTMLEEARAGADMVIGSRYIEGGSAGALTPARRNLSDIASRLAGLVLRQQVSDPMSGFLLMPRSTFDDVLPNLTGLGFKLLLDILSSTRRRLNVIELPYAMSARMHGQSKLDSLVAFEFLELLFAKWFGRFLPVRFLLFAVIGGSGLVLHLGVLWLSLDVAGLAFAGAQTVATVVAMTSNFVLNNQFTFRDRRLKGRRLAAGLVSFYVICSVGAVANVGVGTLVYAERPWWWLAGLAGALVGAVWNFAVSSIYTWRQA